MIKQPEPKMNKHEFFATEEFLPNNDMDIL